MRSLRASRCARQAALLALVLAAACDRSPYRSVRVDTRPGERGAAPGAGAAGTPVLRFSVASIESPRDTFAGYQRLFDRVGRLLDSKVEFVQRRTYREVNDLLIAGELDAALLCSGGYIDLERRAPGAVEAVAVPVLGGAESYSSLLVVPAASDVQEVAELRGRRFAFTDELSLSGHLYPLRALRDLGFDPGRFFGSVIYSGSHDRSVQAVAAGMVDGAAVHGAVLAQMQARDPSLAFRIRVVHRSPPLGGMPVVVSRRLPAQARARIGAVLLALEGDPEAEAALRAVHIDRFKTPSPGLFASAARIAEGR
jgi:phosphonate transport system substrate-binding protein